MRDLNRLLWRTSYEFLCLVIYVHLHTHIHISVSNILFHTHICLCNNNGHSLTSHAINTLRPRQNYRHFADDIFICTFLNVNIWISINVSLKCVLNGPINNISALVQIMAWRRLGDKPLSEPMMVSLLTHICVTQPRWINHQLPTVLLWLTQNINFQCYHLRVCQWYMNVIMLCHITRTAARTTNNVKT